MKKGLTVRLLLILALIAPTAAFADGAPVTLTAQEVQAIVSDLAGRDPVARLLMQKQDQAKKDAEAHAPEPKAP